MLIFLEEHIDTRNLKKLVELFKVEKGKSFANKILEKVVDVPKYAQYQEFIELFTRLLFFNV